MQHTTPPTLDEIAAMAQRALGEIPERFTRAARDLQLVVEDIADDELLDAMGIESGYDLTGLYRATPPEDSDGEPDAVVLYREPILLEWIESGEDLFQLVRTVLIHEIAHHFGFSDADIARLENEG